MVRLFWLKQAWFIVDPTSHVPSRASATARVNHRKRMCMCACVCARANAPALLSALKATSELRVWKAGPRIAYVRPRVHFRETSCRPHPAVAGAARRP